MSSALPKIRRLDICPMVSRGEEPREKIFAALAGLATGESLALVSPFLPSPLIEKFQSDGFSVRPERRSDGTWCTIFRRD